MYTYRICLFYGGWGRKGWEEQQAPLTTPPPLLSKKIQHKKIKTKKNEKKSKNKKVVDNPIPFLHLPPGSAPARSEIN